MVDPQLIPFGYFPISKTIFPIIQNLQSFVNKFFVEHSQNWPAIFNAIRGFRNGAIYGAKIRAPHALVTVMLFGKGNIAKKLRRILELTQRHSLNLAKFIFLYKLAMAFLAKFASNDGKMRHWHPLLAAAIFAHFVFGNRRDGVSEQINLYLLSRVIYALIKFISTKLMQSIAHKNALSKTNNQNNISSTKPALFLSPFPVFASIVWGIGLWLFENHPWTLQNSLRISMQQLYGNGGNDSAQMPTTIWDFLSK